MAYGQEEDYLDELIAERRVGVFPYHSIAKIVIVRVDFERLLKRLHHHIAWICKTTERICNNFCGTQAEVKEAIDLEVNHMLGTALLCLYSRLRNIAMNYSSELFYKNSEFSNQDPPSCEWNEFPAYVSSLMESIGPLHVADPGGEDRYIIYLPPEDTYQNFGRKDPNPKYGLYDRLLYGLKSLNVETSVISQESCLLSKTSGSFWTTCRLQINDDGFKYVLGTVDPSYYKNKDVVRAYCFLSPDPQENPFLDQCQQQMMSSFKPTCHIVHGITDHEFDIVLRQKFLHPKNENIIATSIVCGREKDYLKELINERRVLIKPYYNTRKTVTLRVDFERLLTSLHRHITEIYESNIRICNAYGRTGTWAAIGEDVKQMLGYALMGLYGRLRNVAMSHTSEFYRANSVLLPQEPQGHKRLEFPVYVSSLMESIGPLHVSEPGGENRFIIYLPPEDTIQNYGRKHPPNLNYKGYVRLLDTLKSLNIKTSVISQDSHFFQKLFGSFWTTCRLQTNDRGFIDVLGSAHPSHYENEDAIRACCFLSPDPDKNPFLEEKEETTCSFKPTCYIAHRIAKHEFYSVLRQRVE